jgi:hypothetical protein
MKQTEIEIEKIWKDDEPYVKILGWKNIMNSPDLPNEYRNSKGDIAYQTYTTFKDVDVYITPGYKEPLYNFKIETIMSEKEFNKMINLMRKAGERLSLMNKKAKWGGTEVVKI